MLFLVAVSASGCSAWGVQENVSAEFPYQSRYLEVLDAKMHYVEQGEGDPILLLHGNPTSSYLWRNIIPHLSSHGHVIAVDLIGMGKSDKPDIGYTFMDHSRYLEAFIDKMRLKNVTLVMHDWGSGLGFHYAMRHQDNVKGLAFMEALVRPMRWSDAGPLDRFIFRRLRDPKKGETMIVENNFFLKWFMPMATGRRLSAAEKAYYGQPYLDKSARKPVRVWPTQIPIDGEPPEMYQIVSAYRAALEQSSIPKLLLWGKPGLIIKEQDVQQLQSALPNIEVVYVGKGKHYLPEDQPENIGNALATWYQRLPASSAKAPGHARKSGGSLR
jgi:haloalkane dehalogenase